MRMGVGVEVIVEGTVTGSVIFFERLYMAPVGEACGLVSGGMGHHHPPTAYISHRIAIPHLRENMFTRAGASTGYPPF